MALWGDRRFRLVVIANSRPAEIRLLAVPDTHFFYSRLSQFSHLRDATGSKQPCFECLCTQESKVVLDEMFLWKGSRANGDGALHVATTIHKPDTTTTQRLQRTECTGGAKETKRSLVTRKKSVRWTSMSDKSCALFFSKKDSYQASNNLGNPATSHFDT